MTRPIGALPALALLFALTAPARAADRDADAVLDKAIRALGGKEKLSKFHALTWKAKGTLTLMGSDNEFTTRSTVQGLDHYRGEFEGDIGGNKVEALAVVAGDKGWRKINDNVTELDREALANTRRTAYLAVVPVTVLPLKGKGFKVEAAGEETVAGKPAVVLKVTPADGKEFKLSFDKESGLPVKLVARVAGFVGDEYTQETTFSDYKEMGGIRKATTLVSKRDGEKFVRQQITEFKALDKVDPKTFAEPK